LDEATSAFPSLARLELSRHKTATQEIRLAAMFGYMLVECGAGVFGQYSGFRRERPNFFVACLDMTPEFAHR
jgi:hypothetical protein